MYTFNCYQTQPDGYVRFDWHGKLMEGEFFRYDPFDADIEPKLGYIRPFDKILRQQLIDNLQSTQGIDLLTFIAKSDLISCDAFVTDKKIQCRHQIVIEQFEFIDENEIVSDKKATSNCRVNLLQRQYVLAYNLNESKETLDRINAEFLKWVTPFYMPLRYERKWLNKHQGRILSLILIIAACCAYVLLS